MHKCWYEENSPDVQVTRPKVVELEVGEECNSAGGHSAGSITRYSTV